MARAAQRAAQPRSQRAQLALRTTSFRLGSGPTNGGRPPHGGKKLASFYLLFTLFLPFLNPEKLFLKLEKIFLTLSGCHSDQLSFLYYSLLVEIRSHSISVKSFNCGPILHSSEEKGGLVPVYIQVKKKGGLVPVYIQ